MHDCTPNLTACHSVLGSVGEAICLRHAHTHTQCVWQASLWDIHTHTHTHGPLLVCYREKEGGFGIMSLFHHDSVPESLSSAVWGKAMCAALTDVDSQHAQTQTHTPARFLMHEERPLGPDWTAHIHCSVHPCPFHSHSRTARHTHKFPCTKTHTYKAVMNVKPSWHVFARWESLSHGHACVLIV